ncbi:unnamed protein product [Meganyctiphanes norvegica]|uniref:C2H2-type domain-containing protein n=1 Tax=Meganyctiphanes norvegica TaxID=48144 RepID=A0AAV2RGD2_MEGNR
MGYLHCPLCDSESLTNVRDLQQRMAAALTRPFSCPICSESVSGLPAFHHHLAEHLPIQQPTSIGTPNSVTNSETSSTNINGSSTPQYSSVPNSPESFTEFLSTLSGNNEVPPVHKNNVVGVSTESIPQLERLEIKDDQSNHYGSCSSLISEIQDRPRSENSVEQPQISKPNNGFEKDTGGITSTNQYPCDICGIVYSTENFLKIHKNIVHGNDKMEPSEISCKHCTLSFDNFDTFRAHVSETHSERQYICDRCPKTFKLKGSLLVHKRMFHDPLSPGSCNICHKSFTTRARKELHERRYHGLGLESLFKTPSALSPKSSENQQGKSSITDQSNSLLESLRDKNLEANSNDSKISTPNSPVEQPIDIQSPISQQTVQDTQTLEDQKKIINIERMDLSEYKLPVQNLKEQQINDNQYIMKSNQIHSNSDYQTFLKEEPVQNASKKSCVDESEKCDIGVKTNLFTLNDSTHNSLVNSFPESSNQQDQQMDVDDSCNMDNFLGNLNETSGRNQNISSDILCHATKSMNKKSEKEFENHTFPNVFENFLATELPHSAISEQVSDKTKNSILDKSSRQVAIGNRNINTKGNQESINMIQETEIHTGEIISKTVLQNSPIAIVSPQPQNTIHTTQSSSYHSPVTVYPENVRRNSFPFICSDSNQVSQLNQIIDSNTIQLPPAPPTFMVQKIQQQIQNQQAAFQHLLNHQQNNISTNCIQYPNISPYMLSANAFSMPITTTSLKTSISSPLCSSYSTSLQSDKAGSEFKSGMFSGSIPTLTQSSVNTPKTSWATSDITPVFLSSNISSTEKDITKHTNMTAITNSIKQTIPQNKVPNSLTEKQEIEDDEKSKQPENKIEMPFMSPTSPSSMSMLPVIGNPLITESSKQSDCASTRAEICQIQALLMGNANLQRKDQEAIKDWKQWECDICKKSFTTKYFLKKHKRLHTGETPYSCAECGKTFTFQQSYHKHVLYHSDDKPHQCSHCGRCFKEMSTLHNHVRIHTGEKPFACETCGKAFRQRVSYLVHQRIHTGEMPYHCEACDRSFRYKVSLRSHKCEPGTSPGKCAATYTGSPLLQQNTSLAPAHSPESQNTASSNITMNKSPEATFREQSVGSSDSFHVAMHGPLQIGLDQFEKTQNIALQPTDEKHQQWVQQQKQQSDQLQQQKMVSPHIKNPPLSTIDLSSLRCSPLDGYVEKVTDKNSFNSVPKPSASTSVTNSLGQSGAGGLLQQIVNSQDPVSLALLSAASQPLGYTSQRIPTQVVPSMSQSDHKSQPGTPIMMFPNLSPTHVDHADMDHDTFLNNLLF